MNRNLFINGFQNIHFQFFSLIFSGYTNSGMHANRQVTVSEITQDGDINILNVATLVNIILAS